MGNVDRWVRAVIRRLRRITDRGASSQVSQRQDRPRFATSEREQPVAWWTERLWAGYDVQALAALHRWSREPTAKASVRAGSFLQMARWHLASGDADQAYEYAVLARIASGNMPPQREQPAVEVDALTALGRLDEAAEILELAISRRPDDVDLRLRRANVTHDVERRLQVINEVLLAADLAPIRCQAELTLDGLTVDGVDASDGETDDASLPLVSVIVPAYNAEGTLATALKSLQAQTWAQIEIIVVDDASTDGTVEVAQRFAATDRRVRVVTLDENRGAYAARNVGLAAARGDFITVHDADDWSHPAKIARQMQPLLADAGRIATISEWVRVDDKFNLSWSMRPATRLVHRNYSSLLLRREVIERVGPWDEVRALGDVEMFERIGAVYGQDAVATVLPGVPLSWARKSDSSLTGGSIHAASTRTDIMGARRLYAEAFRWWHAQGGLDEYLPLDSACRPFPIADALRPAVAPRPVDMIVACDLRQHGPAVLHHAEWVETLSALERVAVMDLPDIDSPLSPVASQVLENLAHRGVMLVSAGSPGLVDKLLVVGIRGLLNPPCSLPELQVKEARLVVESEAQFATEAQFDAMLEWLEASVSESVWQPLHATRPLDALLKSLSARGCSIDERPWIASGGRR